jgi:hypothetical protein
MQLLKRFFKSDVTCAEMQNCGDMHKEAGQVKMWLQRRNMFLETKESLITGLLTW